MIMHPGGTAEQFTYGGDYLDSVTTPAGTTSLEHDMLGRLTRIVDPDGSDRRFSYDPKGKMTSQTSKSGMVTNYSYAGGRFATATRMGVTRPLAPADAVGESRPEQGVRG